MINAMTNSACIFCINDQTKPIGNDPANRVIKMYENWMLVLQPEAKRQKTKQAAGMLIPKRHVEVPSRLNEQESAELFTIYKDASRTLCEHVGVTYAGQETVGFNEGALAGQTINHAHIHILPVAEEDPEALKVRGGIGGAFEALRSKRLG
jgi:diadenosine tetraphosphate (Ap4A) HIT family hydrolase